MEFPINPAPSGEASERPSASTIPKITAAPPTPSMDQVNHTPLDCVSGADITSDAGSFAGFGVVPQLKSEQDRSMSPETFKREQMSPSMHSHSMHSQTSITSFESCRHYFSHRIRGDVFAIVTKNAFKLF